MGDWERFGDEGVRARLWRDDEGRTHQEFFQFVIAGYAPDGHLFYEKSPTLHVVRDGEKWVTA